jgi:hypothetical protein
MIYLFLLLLLTAIGVSWIISNIKYGKPFIKFLFISFYIYLTLCIFFAFDNSMGWPTKNRPPDKLFLKSFVISEPTEQYSGAIYIWGVPKISSQQCSTAVICIRREDSNEPRSYVLEYKKETHKALASAEGSLERGEVIIFEITTKQSSNNEQVNIYELPSISDILRKD